MFSPESLIGQQIDQFRLDQFVAKGAMCIVYKAFDTVLVRTVALKLIPKRVMDGLSNEDTARLEEARKRLIQEAKAAGRLSHPNIVTIHSYGQTEEFEYICMEFVSGQTLTQILNERKTLGVGEAIGIFQQVLMALDVANRAHIVHRDIKPGNIMVTDDGIVKVMDFGIAKLPSFSMTTTGTVLGTPYYMSPEQITGQEVDIRSDIFSLGAVLYQALTGERPFEATNTATLAYKIVQVEPIPPDVVNIHIPHPLGNIVRKALAKNPADRFQDPLEMLRAIRAARLDGPHGRSANSASAVTAAVDPDSPRSAAAGEFGRDSNGGEPSSVGPWLTQEATSQPLASGLPHSGSVSHSEGILGSETSESAEKAGEGIHAEASADGADGAFRDPAGPGSPGEDGSSDLAVIRATSNDVPMSYIPPNRRGGRDQRSASYSRSFGLVALLVVLVGFGIYAGLKVPNKPRTQIQQTVQVGSPESRQSQIAGPSANLSDDIRGRVNMMVEDAKARLEDNTNGAQSLLEKAIAQDPRHFEAHSILGKLLISKQDFQGAIQAYQGAIRINGQSADAYFNLGYAYMAIGDFDSAIASYESCWALKPPYQDEVLTNLAISYLKKNQSDRAHSLFKQALDLNPDNPVARNYLETAGALPTALQAHLQPPQSKPLEPSIPGPAQMSAGVQGEVFIPPAVRGSVDSLVNQAKMQFDTNAENAQKLLEEAIAQDPRHFDAVFQLGRLLTFRKDYSAAIQRYQAALSINNQAPDVFFNLGYVYMSLKDYDSAIVNYEACRALSPPYQDEVLTNLGISYLKKNNLQHAQFLFKQAMELNPKNTIARNYLKNLERSQKGMMSSVSSDAVQGKAFSAYGETGKASALQLVPLEGKYSVRGVNSSGNPYVGTATIGKKGDSFTMTWNIGGKVFTGDGSLSEGRLTVNWKNEEGLRGIVVYTVRDGGVLQGEWADGRGAETLTRLR